MGVIAHCAKLLVEVILAEAIEIDVGSIIVAESVDHLRLIGSILCQLLEIGSTFLVAQHAESSIGL